MRFEFYSAATQQCVCHCSVEFPLRVSDPSNPQEFSLDQRTPNLVVHGETCGVAHVDKPQNVKVQHDKTVACPVCKRPHTVDHLVTRMISDEGEVCCFADRLLGVVQPERN